MLFYILKVLLNSNLPQCILFCEKDSTHLQSHLAAARKVMHGQSQMHEEGGVNGFVEESVRTKGSKNWAALTIKEGQASVFAIISLNHNILPHQGREPCSCFLINPLESLQ